jgi:hypothetical protein
MNVNQPRMDLPSPAMKDTNLKSEGYGGQARIDAKKKEALTADGRRFTADNFDEKLAASSPQKYSRRSAFICGWLLFYSCLFASIRGYGFKVLRECR